MLRLRLDRGWGSREGVYEDMGRREMDYVGMMLDYHICIALHGMEFFDRCVALYIQVICLCGWLVKSRSSSPFFPVFISIFSFLHSHIINTLSNNLSSCRVHGT
jgi:hypothetical protein